MLEYQIDFPLVTVCIPVYNHYRFVKECIQSVVEQDYENIELIIIDDGSNDDSFLIVEDCISKCKNRFKRFNFIQRENKGVCYTLNEAIEWSQGKFFGSIASDDVWLSNKVSCQIEYLKKNESASAVFGGVILIDQNSIEIKKIYGKNIKYNFEDILLKNSTIFAVTNLIRIDDLKGTGGYHIDRKLEDFYMWLKLTECVGKTIDVTPQIVAKYRLHSHNISRNYKCMHADMVRITKDYINHPLYKLAVDSVFLESSNSAAFYNKRDAFMYLSKAKFRFQKNYFKALIKIFMPKYLLNKLAKIL